MSDISSKIAALNKQINALNKVSSNLFGNQQKKRLQKEDVDEEITAISNQLQTLVDELAEFKPSQVKEKKSDKPASTDEAHKDELSKFLSSIGESVVASQENLDRQSIKYLKQLPGYGTHSNIIPPTVFRIPKLKASLSLGIEKSESKGLNVLIFSKEEESKKINKQSVELEIMAVPASAELLQNIDGKVPQIQFVFNKNERAEIFEKLDTVKKEDPDFTPVRYGDLFENQDRVIFWRTTKSDADASEIFLVLYAGHFKKQRGVTTATHKAKNVCLWQLDFKKAKLDMIIRYDLAPPSPTKQRFDLLYDFVDKLAQRQVDLIQD